MSNRLIRKAALVALFLMLSVRSSSAATPEDPSTVTVRVYAVYYIPFYDAKLLVEERLGAQLPPSALGGYRIDAEAPRSGGPGNPSGFIRVAADRQVQDLVVKILKDLDTPVPDRVFQVFLLEASKEASGTPELPSGAARAVRDLQEIMPFRGFRTLESGLIRSAREGDVRLGSEFTIELKFQTQRDTALPVLVEKFSLVHLTPSKTEPGKSDHRMVLQTSFSIRRGETVVVGTSKLDGGDNAIVVLVTAVE